VLVVLCCAKYPFHFIFRKNLWQRLRVFYFYDRCNILKEIEDEPIELGLDDTLRENIILGKRKYQLKNITIKLDPLHVQAIKKIATMKSIPYQTLIRSWLAKEIKKELHI
jgi:predicted DNA binding CopG/RHH family protein